MSEVDELARIREFNVDRAELVEREEWPQRHIEESTTTYSSDDLLKPRRSLSRDNGTTGGGRSHSGAKYNIETRVDKGRLLNFSDELERERRRAEMALNRPRMEGPLRPKCTTPCQSEYLNDLAKPKPVPVPEDEAVPQPPRLAIGGGGGSGSGGLSTAEAQRARKLKLLAPPPRPESTSGITQSPLVGVPPTRTPLRSPSDRGGAAPAPRANRRQSVSPHGAGIGTPLGVEPRGGSRKTSALLHAMRSVAAAPGAAATSSRHTGMTIVKTTEEEERVRHARLHDQSTAWGALPQHYQQLEKVQSSMASSASSSPQPQGIVQGAVAISTTVLDDRRAADYGIARPPGSGGRGGAGGTAANPRRPVASRGGKSASDPHSHASRAGRGAVASSARPSSTTRTNATVPHSTTPHTKHPPDIIAGGAASRSSGVRAAAAPQSEDVAEEEAGAMRRFEYNSSAEAVPVLRRPSSVTESSVSQDSRVRPERRVHIDPTATTVIEVEKVHYADDDDDDDDRDAEDARGERVSSVRVASIASDPNEEPVMPDPPVKVVARRNRSAEPMQWPPPSYTEQTGVKLSPVQLRLDDGEGSPFTSALYGTNHLSVGRAPAVVVVRRLDDSDSDDGGRKKKGKKKSKK